MAAWLPPDDRHVVTVAGRLLRVRDSGNNQIVAERTVALSTITALAATPEGAFVVVGERSGGMDRVEAGTLAPGGPRLQFNLPVNAVATGPGDSAVALLDDKTYAIVDLAEGSVLATGSLGLTPTAAAISPDGSRLAVGGSVGEVGLLDLNSHEWIASPTAAHRQFVDGIVVAHDGRTLVTSSFDGGVRLRDAETGAAVAGVQVGQQSGGGHAPAGQAGCARRHPGWCGVSAGYPVRSVVCVRLHRRGPQPQRPGMARGFRGPALSFNLSDGMTGRGGWPQRTSLVSAR